MRKALKVLLILLLAVLVLAAAYVAYVFLAYHRIPDNQPLTVETPVSHTRRTTTGAAWPSGPSPGPGPRSA